jgi:O-antigen/teichoic acid export membrane protein
VGQMSRKTLSPVIIGAWLGLAAVTPFSLASSLVGYTLLLVIAGTGVLVPVATRLHARNDAAQQARLLLDGGKACFALGLFFVAGFVLLGPSFIRLWVGARLGAAATLLAILGAGELLPMSQYATETILLGTARHRPLAWFSLAEAAVGAALAIASMSRFGLAGACVSLAVSATACRGFGTLALGLRQCGVGWPAYVRAVIVPPILALSLPAAGLAVLVAARPPGSWITLVAFGAVFFVLSCGGALWLIGWEVVRRNASVVAERIPFFSREKPER